MDGELALGVPPKIDTTPIYLNGGNTYQTTFGGQLSLDPSVLGWNMGNTGFDGSSASVAGILLNNSNNNGSPIMQNTTGTNQNVDTTMPYQNNRWYLVPDGTLHVRYASLLELYFGNQPYLKLPDGSEVNLNEDEVQLPFAFSEPIHGAKVKLTANTAAALVALGVMQKQVVSETNLHIPNTPFVASPTSNLPSKDHATFFDAIVTGGSSLTTLAILGLIVFFAVKGKL